MKSKNCSMSSAHLSTAGGHAAAFHSKVFSRILFRLSSLALFEFSDQLLIVRDLVIPHNEIAETNR